MQYEGATKERLEKEPIVITARDSRVGGSIGQAVKYPLLLDYLKDHGLLGGIEDMQDRHNAGIKLRTLYYTFKRTGKPLDEMGGHKNQFVIGENLTTAEQAEQSFHAIMKAMPAKYKQIAYIVCVDNQVPREYTTDQYIIVDMLDALAGQFLYLKI